MWFCIVVQGVFKVTPPIKFPSVIRLNKLFSEKVRASGLASPLSVRPQGKMFYVLRSKYQKITYRLQLKRLKKNPVPFYTVLETLIDQIKDLTPKLTSVKYLLRPVFVLCFHLLFWTCCIQLEREERAKTMSSLAWFFPVSFLSMLARLILIWKVCSHD